MAAAPGDMSDLTLCDAINRYNAEDLNGLYDRPRSGRPSKVTEAQWAELREIAVRGADVENDGLSVYTHDGLVAVAAVKWQVAYDPTSIRRILRKALAHLLPGRGAHRPERPRASPLASKGQRPPVTADQRFTFAYMCAGSLRRR